MDVVTDRTNGALAGEDVWVVNLESEGYSKTAFCTTPEAAEKLIVELVEEGYDVAEISVVHGKTVRLQVTVEKVVRVSNVRLFTLPGARIL